MKLKDVKKQSAKMLASVSLKLGKISATVRVVIFIISRKCRRN